MENKKTYKFGIEDDSFFIEKRLVFKGPKAKSPPPEETDPSEEESVEEEKTAPEKEAAEAEKEAATLETKTGTSKAITKARGQAEREKVKPVQLPPPPTPKALESFKQKADTGEPKKELDFLKINILGEGHQSNATKWRHFDEEGLKEIYRDCREAGIPVNDPFYKSMFGILNMGIGSQNTHLADPEYQIYFQDPANHMKELLGLSVCPSGFDPIAFAKAYEHLQYIQGKLLAQDAYKVKTLAAQEGLDKDPVASKVTDFLRSNLDQFKKAIKERDYATAGLYCVGIWAIYRSMKELGVFGKEGKSTKWLAYGLATYCGYVFAKNAGYDVLKIAGFRDQDYEVKGTPLEAIDNILRSQPHLRELAKDLDYGIVLRMSEVSLADLNELFNKTNRAGAGGIQFIHPYEFPEIFPDLAKQWSFEMGMGETGLKDYTGMPNTKLSTNQREYIRVGKQLYKLALAMRGVYEATLYKEHPEYKGLPYEKVLADPTKGLGKVRHLLGAAYDYAPAKPERGLTSTKSIDEAQEHLDKAFQGLEVGPTLERQVGKSGHFEGKIMEYPVVFVRTGNVYRVYLKPSYQGAEKPGINFIAEIPIEEGSKQILEVRKAVDGVRGKMLDLLRPLYGTGGRKITDTSLKYEYGQWTCDVSLPGATEFDVNSKPSKAILIPHPEGKRIDLIVNDDVRITVDEEVNKQYPIGLALIPKIVSQKEFHALKVFSNSSLLRAEDPTPGDSKITLLVGPKNLKLDLSYNKGTKQFTADPLQEEKLVQAFDLDYINALGEDTHFGLNKNIKDLAALITKSAPENFVSYFFESLFQETLKSPLDGVNLDLISGSVPDYYALMVLEATKGEAMQKLRRKINTSKNLQEVEESRKSIINVLNAKLLAIKQTLSERSTELAKDGKTWDRDQFETEIIDRIRAANGGSQAYQYARKNFEYMAYSLSLPGLTQKSDLNQNSHLVVGKLMGVYSFYTSYLDNHNFKGIDINLDKLTFPPTPTPGIADFKEDPALRGHCILRYFEYVKTQIYSKSSQLSNLNTLPDATARGFWDIDDFDKWLQTDGNYSPLDEADNEPAMTHDVNHPGYMHTNLDKYMADEFKKTKDFLIAEYGDVIDPYAIDEYLNKDWKNPATGLWDPNVKEHQIGIFKRYPIIDPANPGAYLKDASGKDIYKCKLWDKSNRVATASGNRKSVQIKLVEREIQSFVNYVFTAKKGNGDYLFFKSRPPLTTNLVRKWPWLRHIF